MREKMLDIVTKLDIATKSARRFIDAGAHQRLWNLLKSLHSADIAALLNRLFLKERKVVINVLYENDKEKTAEVLSELEPEDAVELLKDMQPQDIALILQEFSSDDAVQIVEFLPEDIKTQVLDLMRKKESEDVRELLHYEEKTAGRIMSTEYYALEKNTRVADAITALQLAGDIESAFYLYVVDKDNHLEGVVSLRQLLLHPPNTQLKDIMTTDVIRVFTDTDQEEVARQVARYNLVAIPVVDHENKLVGVVTVDDIIDVINEEATEDMYRMAGVDESDRIQYSPIKSIKKRLPFLYLSLITASLAPFVVNFFKDTIKEAVILAVFMPLVAALGGIAGNQTIALMVREITLGQVSWLTARKALFKEVAVGIGNGIAIGSVLGLISYFLYGKPILGLILGLAVIINLFIAGLLGTLIPLILKFLRLDPALGSVNLLTMCTDTFGMLSLLGLGTLFLHYLQ
ncbi:magnesium transporter [Candidatus Aminicenantes bacterium AC-335-B20]|jgi:magnesium transporter|nr:magnesium transporter [SCandidatus Aminicenantes bacterium Aminicenantia_JdfR_composite]MCP2596434.1 magnesium transporter [Candidatus Aminicenantes bacterium AC-335-G13]MCP2599226.1 magnesium transporter [Candidatus Aminicenantes bacterium AC-335-B20]MCP2618188.1 magnesium transporter [Candidatus Aminicenantes bacterium AC-335-A11]